MPGGGDLRRLCQEEAKALGERQIKVSAVQLEARTVSTVANGTTGGGGGGAPRPLHQVPRSRHRGRAGAMPAKGWKFKRAE